MTAFVPSQGPEQLPEKSVNLQVVLLYENTRSGLRAKQAFDHLRAELEIEASFRFEPVGFDLLRDPQVGKNVARTTAGADIVVIAADDVDLPRQVETWLIEWMAGRTHATAALVVSMDESVCDDSVTANFLHHIMDLTSRPGISLFHHFAATPEEKATVSLGEEWRKEGRMVSSFPGTLCRSESPRFRT